MTLLAITSFSGEAPRYAVDKLPGNAAQAALNCRFTSGDLQAMFGVSSPARFAGGLNNPTGAWFTDDGNGFCWTGSYTVAKSTVINDFYRRVYYTDGTPYLRVVQQRSAGAFVNEWLVGTVYNVNNTVIAPSSTTADFNPATTYKKGDWARYPNTTGLTYRSTRDNNLGHQPDVMPAWWESMPRAKFYISLASGNLGHAPESSPTWWRPALVSLVGLITRAGVPAPAKYTAKKFGSGVNNLNAPSTDPKGEQSVYNVPQAVVDERAETDGSLTGVPTTNALVAVARTSPIDQLALRADFSAADDTAQTYYSSDKTKVDQTTVQMYPVKPGRLYTFDAPAKGDTHNEFVITDMLIEPGNDGATPVVTPDQGA